MEPRWDAILGAVFVRIFFHSVEWLFECRKREIMNRNTVLNTRTFEILFRIVLAEGINFLDKSFMDI